MQETTTRRGKKSTKLMMVTAIAVATRKNAGNTIEVEKKRNLLFNGAESRPPLLETFSAECRSCIIEREKGETTVLQFLELKTSL